MIAALWGLAVWLAAAVLTGLLIGGAVQVRNRQVPELGEERDRR